MICARYAPSLCTSFGKLCVRRAPTQMRPCSTQRLPLPSQARVLPRGNIDAAGALGSPHVGPLDPTHSGPGTPGGALAHVRLAHGENVVCNGSAAGVARTARHEHAVSGSARRGDVGGGRRPGCALRPGHSPADGHPACMHSWMRDTISRYITHISHRTCVNISRIISRTYHGISLVYQISRDVS